MACFKDGTIIDLTTRESLALPDFRGTTLRVTRGTVWITQEHDTQDIVLRAGDTWVVERNGLTLLEAQEDSTFCVLGRAVATWMAPRPARRSQAVLAWRHVCEAVARFLAAPPRAHVPYA